MSANDLITKNDIKYMYTYGFTAKMCITCIFTTKSVNVHVQTGKCPKIPTWGVFKWYCCAILSIFSALILGEIF